MIIALCGHKSEGKDTAYKFITEMYPNKSFVNIKFASAMKEVGCVIFGWKMEDYENSNWKETIDENYGFTPRKWLEWFGTEVMQKKMCQDFPDFELKVGKKLWAYKTLKEALNLEQQGKIVIITDMRFPHEATALQNKAVVVKLHRPALKYDTTSFVEKQVDLVPYKYKVINPENEFEQYRTNLKLVMEFIFNNS